jgi:sec-independent protein translocase protein TatC
MPGRSDDGACHCDFFEVLAMEENRTELRSRLFRIGIGFALAFVVGLLLTRQLVGSADEHLGFERYGPGPSIADFFRIGFSFAVALSTLVIVQEIIAFASPILTRKERRFAYGSLPFVGLFFLLGTAMAYYAVGQASSSTKLCCESLDYGSMGSSVVQFSFAIGIIFELCFVMFLLARLGIFGPTCLSACRRYAAATAILAAIVVTPESFSLQMLFRAAVLYLFYEVGIMLARFAWWRRSRSNLRHDANSAAVYGTMTSAEFWGVIRSHLVRFCVVTGLAFIAGLFLMRPMLDLARDRVSLARICCDRGQELSGAIGVFDFFIKAGLPLAIAVGLLFFYCQVVSFASPRLSRTERRLAWGSLPILVLFFLLGTAFTFYAVLPGMLGFMEKFWTWGNKFPTTRLTVSFYGPVPLLVGSVFELLVIMFMFSLLGIVRPARMSASRHFVAVIALSAATILTPWPIRFDLLLLVTGLIYVLYEIGIMMASVADSQRNRTRTSDGWFAPPAETGGPIDARVAR